VRRAWAGAAALAGAGACTTAPPSAPTPVLEFESAARGGERAACFTASGGAALHATAATPPIVVARSGAGAASSDALWIRCAGTGSGRGCALRLRDGGAARTIELPASGQRERFEWTALPIAAAAGGEVEIAVAENGGELWLDQFAWGSATRPPDPAASPPVWRDGPLELRAAPGARVFDPEWVQHLLREQYGAVARLLGRELRGPLLLIALPAATWPRPGAGAFQQSRAIFLRDDELHLPWRSFSHEIAHVFEEERAASLPRFWSEGLACALADEVEARLYERGVARARVRWTRLLARGDALYRPSSAPPNPALAFARSQADGATSDRSDYEWAGAVVDALAQAGGPGYFARLEAGLDAAKPGVGAGDTAAAAAPFVAAARADVSGILQRAGIPWPPAAPRDVPAAGATPSGSR
jgi:hypothetical protein